MLIPLICAYLFNQHSIHFAPTLKKNRVLRIEPPLTITATEVQAILLALKDVCELIAQFGCAGLIYFMLTRLEMPHAARHNQGVDARPRWALVRLLHSSNQ